ncbi:MAG: hypothetical protein M8357_05560 [Desulfobulbaceae bacterium]|nr:hypothetical protein [Desulfobulbaceae bacterium]
MDQYCWDIIQCDDKGSCPARLYNKKPCWEVMAEHNSFQCHYGLCEECIVYLSKSRDTSFSVKELDELMRMREAGHQLY